MGETFLGNAQYDAKTAMNGTFGEVYIDNMLVAEATGLKAIAQFEFMAVPMCGTLSKHKKLSGLECKGTITLTKINSRFALMISEAIKTGKTPEFTIMSNLADPEAAGREAVVLYGCQFDSLTLADWAANTLTTLDVQFEFNNWQYIDLIAI